MLGHEIRNPLASISNAMHLIRLEPSETPVQRQARIIIERQLVQMTRLVDDQLEVSRFTTGRVQRRRERVSINSIEEHSLETARPLIDSFAHTIYGGSAARTDLVVRRCRPVGPGGRKSARQCREVHAARGPHRAECRSARPVVRGAGARYGHRHLSGAAARHLRTVHAGRTVVGSRARRVGRGADAGEADGGVARGSGGGAKLTRGRQRACGAFSGGTLCRAADARDHVRGCPTGVRVLQMLQDANGRHAIHDWHHHIGQHTGDVLRTCRALRHRVGSVRRQQRAVAESLQRQPPHPYP